MSSASKRPSDHGARRELVTGFSRNLLVEAGAGSGKTHSLAARMAAGIAAGHYTVDRMAAVTFTRKAAAELRGRFRLALEEGVPHARGEAERARLRAALAGIERLFTGTIHAFCAHLLRERPVDADLAPGFEELDEAANVARLQRAWREFVNAARATRAPDMMAVLEAGLEPKDLYDTFATFCEHEDVAFDRGGAGAPALEPAFGRVRAFWAGLSALAPAAFAVGTKCPVQQKYHDMRGRLAHLAFDPSLPGLAGLLAAWGSPDVTMKWWSAEVGRGPSYGSQARDLVAQFNEDVAGPFLEAWRAHVHGIVMRVLERARRDFAESRRRENLVNYVDLLQRTRALLREHATVRHALQQKYRWLFVDEFQDTDPIQAEIFLMLAGDEDGDGPRRRGPCDPFRLPLRPGALFVVGDPKQSIFRFRRADIDTYTSVRERIEESGGMVVSLTANFRSRPGVCDLANTVFPPLFDRWPAPYSPEYTPLEPVKAATASPGVMRLTVTGGRGDAAAEDEARKIAAFIQEEVTSGRRKHEDFLVLTRQTRRLRVYADEFDRAQIPVEVSGAGRFCRSPEVRALGQLLAALADPLDGVALVGVLRGPLFGVSDPELFRFVRAGGRLELTAPLPPAGDAAAEEGLAATFGPALGVMRRLQEMLRDTRRMPLAAAVERMLEQTGWLALAAATPGGARAGHLLQAVDRVREVVEDGGGLVDAAAALDDEEPANEAEAWPLEPGRRGVVRLMNLHKAKGLEAPVVFLADPTHVFDFPLWLRIERTDGAARGVLRVVKAFEGKPWAPRVLGEPRDWARHADEEEKYRQAERCRLLYVAATRAKELLVVGTTGDAKADKAWAPFSRYLASVPELAVPAPPPVVAPAAPDLSTAALAGASRALEERRARVRGPSWAVASPSATKVRLALAERAVEVASTADAAAGVPRSSSHRADAGAAWGSLVHGLLEHAMRHEGSTRDDLRRLAVWLTVETPELRPVIPEALDLVASVMASPFWAEARRSAEVRVEVPFAARVAAGEALPGVVAAGVPTVLQGVIDLVYRAGAGWRLLDYKTDQLPDAADPVVELQARYGAQLAQYRLAWERVAGQPVESAALVAVRHRLVVPID